MLTEVKQRRDYGRVQQELYNTSLQLHAEGFREDNISVRNV